MRSIMKKLVGFLTISSIWLLPVILPEIQAQQTTTPPATATSSPAITIEELKSRRIAIESMTDIDATVKTVSLKYIDQAIAHAEQALSTNNKANEFLQLIQTAPERLKILQDELKKSFMPWKPFDHAIRLLMGMPIGSAKAQKKQSAWEMLLLQHLRQALKRKMCSTFQTRLKPGTKKANGVTNSLARLGCLLGICRARVFLPRPQPRC